MTGPATVPPIVQVDAAGDSDQSAWRQFVAASDDGGFFHRAEWPALLARSFPYRDTSLIARENGVVTGVMPLMSVRSPFTGRALISIPIGVTAGPLAATRPAGDALVERAISLARDRNAKYLEIRCKTQDDLPGENPWFTATDFANFEKDLPGTAEEALLQIPRKQRAEVRRGMKEGLTAVPGDIDEFYPLYARTTRGHGTPPLSKDFFRRLLGAFSPDADILIVRRAGEVVCGVFSFYHRDCVMPYYAGARDEARTVGGFAFMYHALMAHALNRGMRRFDFGRSFVDSGAYAFKANFGFTPRPLYYRFHARKREDLPALHPDNPRLKPLLAMWRLLPLPVTVALGSRLAWMAP